MGNDIKKVVVGIPHYDVFTWEVVKSLIFLVKNSIHDVRISAIKSPYIHQSQNLLFKEAQDIDADYLLIVETDMTFEYNALDKLITLDKDIVSGMYYNRTFPHTPMAYKWTNIEGYVHQNLVNIPEEPFKVDSCGVGLLLISKKVLSAYNKDVYNKYGKPFTHKTFNDGFGEDSIGQDTSFCMRMRDLGFEIWIDPRVKAGHIGNVIVKEGHWAMARKIIEENNKK